GGRPRCAAWRSEGSILHDSESKDGDNQVLHLCSLRPRLSLDGDDEHDPQQNTNPKRQPRRLLLADAEAVAIIYLQFSTPPARLTCLDPLLTVRKRYPDPCGTRIHDPRR